MKPSVAEYAEREGVSIFVLAMTGNRSVCDFLIDHFIEKNLL